MEMIIHVFIMIMTIVIVVIVIIFVRLILIKVLFISKIEDCYSGIEKTTLTGNYNPNHFTTKRIIVIQMK